MWNTEEMVSYNAAIWEVIKIFVIVGCVGLSIATAFLFLGKFIRSKIKSMRKR